MRIRSFAAGLGVAAVMSMGFVLPAGASPTRRPPTFTAQTYTTHCSQANDTSTGEPLTVTTTTTQITWPWALTIGRATVSGGPNGKTLSFPLLYKATPPPPTVPSDYPTTYAGWVVIGDAGVLGDGGPIYLEGGTGSVDHYGQAGVTSGRSFDLCAALGYPPAA
jgi:hypothetical protein